jgi:hypothetical protein
MIKDDGVAGAWKSLGSSLPHSELPRHILSDSSKGFPG